MSLVSTHRPIHKGFLSADEVSEMVALWKRTPGFDATMPGRAYDYHGLGSAPIHLTLKVLELVDAKDPEAKYLDSFFLHYRHGQSCLGHTDARSAARVNVLLIKPPFGGEFVINGRVHEMDVGDAVAFEPRKDVHSVTPVMHGDRLVWSMGLGTRPTEVVQARNRLPR